MCFEEWQKQDGGTFTVLRLVFSHFDGFTLASVRLVCRLWCEAASEEGLWRALVKRELCRSLETAEAELRLRTLSADGGVSWYEEYCRIHRPWIPRVKLRDNEQDEGPIEAAAICCCGSKVAALWRSGGFTVWRVFTDSQQKRRFEAASIEAKVSGIGSGDEGRGGGVQWSSDCDRLLVTRRVVLSQRWELAVYRRRFSEDSTSLQLVTRMTCSGGAGRAWAGAGAGGCWAGSDAVLTLQPALATRRHLVTDVWLNAADQSTWSEKEGVAEPLLRVYNEHRAFMTHVAVAEIASNNEENKNADLSAVSLERATRHALCGHSKDTEKLNPWFIYTDGAEESPLGHATSLSSICLPPLMPSPLTFDVSLAERFEAAKRRRSAPVEEEIEEEEPSEEELRAICTKADYNAVLPGRVVGMVLHPTRPPHRCAVVSVSPEGACAHQVCVVSLPQLVILRVLHSSHHGAASMGIHYVQPYASEFYIGSPAPSEGPLRLWCSLTGAEVRVPPRAPSAAPAVALLLKSDKTTNYALVAAGRALHVWSSGPLEDHKYQAFEVSSDEDMTDDDDSR